MSYSDKISSCAAPQHKCHTCQQVECTCHRYQPVVTQYFPVAKKDNCDPCGVQYAMKATPVATCEAAPVCYQAQTVEQCVEPENGVSSPNGLYRDYIVGLGKEAKVKLPGSNSNTGHNLIPWSMIDWSFLDPTYPFTPRIVADCSGTTYEETDRTTLVVKSPAGDILRTFKAPSIAGGGSAGVSLRITDSSPLTDQTINIPTGTAINVDAGSGIDLVPLNNGFRIINSAQAIPIKIVGVAGSGIVVTGGTVVQDTDGIPKQIFNVGIDCGTLRTNCGLVKSVNNVLPDSNGNVTIPTGNSGGLTSVVSTDGTVKYTYPSTGVVDLGVNYDKLKEVLLPRPVGTTGNQNDVLVNNGDGTTSWKNICTLITEQGCSAGSGGTSNCPDGTRTVNTAYATGVVNGSVNFQYVFNQTYVGSNTALYTSDSTYNQGGYPVNEHPTSQNQQVVSKNTGTLLDVNLTNPFPCERVAKVTFVIRHNVKMDINFRPSINNQSTNIYGDLSADLKYKLTLLSTNANLIAGDARRPDIVSNPNQAFNSMVLTNKRNRRKDVFAWVPTANTEYLSGFTDKFEDDYSKTVFLSIPGNATQNIKLNVEDYFAFFWAGFFTPGISVGTNSFQNIQLEGYYVEWMQKA